MSPRSSCPGFMSHGCPVNANANTTMPISNAARSRRRLGDVVPTVAGGRPGPWSLFRVLMRTDRPNTNAATRTAVRRSDHASKWPAAMANVNSPNMTAPMPCR